MVFTKAQTLTAGLAILFTVGCGSVAEGEDTATVKSAQDTGSFTYFTCNATGWQPSDATRLLRVDTIDSALDFDVKEFWMLGSGDDCTFVTTNAFNGWGTEQTRFGGFMQGPDVTDPNLYVVGSGAVGRFFGEGQFKVRYPALGRFEVRIFPARAAFTITPVTSSSP